MGTTPYVTAPTIPSSLFFIYQCMFAVITPALAFGATAERMTLGPAVLFLFTWSSFVYDIVAAWVWNPNGWLSRLGVMDYAGGSVVHFAAGAAGLAYALVLGRRHAKSHVLHPSPTQNVPFIYLGTGLLWFGWLGFNGGSALAANARAIQAIINSNLAACVGGTTWFALDYYRGERKFSLIGFCTGVIAGLATITPGCGFVSGWASIVIGVVGSTVCYSASVLKKHYPFDDPLDVFPVHFVGGAVGMVMTGIFATRDVIKLSYADGADVPIGGWLDGHFIQVPIQLLASASVGGWSFVVTYGLLYVMDKIPQLHLRLREEDELRGTDETQMGESAFWHLTPSAEMEKGPMVRVGGWAGAVPIAAEAK